MTVIPLKIGTLRTVPKIGKRSGRFGNQRMDRNHTNYSITQTSQNPEKSSGELKRLAVIQTPLKDHQLMLV